MKIKVIILFVTVLLLTSTLFGCSGGVSGDEAKAHIREFFNAIEAQDYEKATTYLHPELSESLEEFFSGIETSYGVDFSSEIEIKKYTGFSSQYYVGSSGGSTYKLDMKLTVGLKELNASIEILKNDKGYGIHYLDITK